MTAKTDSPPHRLVSKQNAQSCLVLALAGLDRRPRQNHVRRIYVHAITIDGFVIRDVRPHQVVPGTLPIFARGGTERSRRAGPRPLRAMRRQCQRSSCAIWSRTAVTASISAGSCPEATSTP